tara:strand:+ start:1357 stop:1569 length:213 start_codon:yes stop_codon:yes gene_type:complete
VINFIKAAFTFRNLLIFTLGGLAFVILLLIIQLILNISLEGFLDDDLIFPILIGGALALNRFEKTYSDKK